MIDKKDLKKIYIWKIKMLKQEHGTCGTYNNVVVAVPAFPTCSRYPATMKFRKIKKFKKEL